MREKPNRITAGDINSLDNVIGELYRPTTDLKFVSFAHFVGKRGLGLTTLNVETLRETKKVTVEGRGNQNFIQLLNSYLESSRMFLANAQYNTYKGAEISGNLYHI